jgi:hypothetical protein
MHMKSMGKSLLAVALIAMLAPIATAANHGKGVVNGKKGNKKQAWRVAYAKESPHPQTQDLALRLHISRPDDNSNALIGALTRYDRVDDETTPTNYVKRSGTAGTVSLEGFIMKEGTPGKKVREEFALRGTYTQDGVFHIITIRGYHSVGRLKADTEGGRVDDQLCLRVSVCSAQLPSPDGMKVRGDPCDEQPPDEDVLTEEDAPPADQDEDPYDGE